MKHKLTLIIATDDKPALVRILEKIEDICNENGVVNVQECIEVPVDS